MPQQQKVSTENNFISGFKTDFTALNFPENAATDTDNCVYDFEGDVLRRFGFDLEDGAETLSIPSDDVGAVTTYVWKNAGGDGNTVVFVLQVGTTLYFYQATDMTTDPVHLLSTTRLASTVDLADFVVSASEVPECQYSDGNGYLFVYNPVLEPFYCKFESGVITATQIDIKIRDFKGIPDNEGVGGIGDLKERPTTLTDAHKYNLLNQGWTQGQRWEATFDYAGDAGLGYLPLSWTGNGCCAFGPHQVGGSGANNNYPNSLAHHFWTVPAGLPTFVGQQLQFSYTIGVTVYNIEDVSWSFSTTSGTGLATVLAYSGTSMEALINNVNPYVQDSRLELDNATSPFHLRVRTADSENTLDVFFEQCGVYPSNTDVWFAFKETETINTFSGGGGTLDSERFHPGRTIGLVIQPSSQAPAGHFILDAFNLDKATASGIGGLTTDATDKRPRTGAWYAGRVFYAGVDDAQAASGTEPYYTWTENIYFSQIIEDSSGTQFGKCYQFDDPTDENEFNLLPTDGGVITIQGSGSIFKMFAIQNGILVFAANGIWFITGSQGVGFSANDYTVTKISGIRSISGSSFVDVNGLPFFWNEEAIYQVEEAQQGSGVSVNPITVHSISRYYEDIPYQAKVAARGSYDPINYVVQWVFDRGLAPAVPDEPPPPPVEVPYRIMIFDDCCQLYVTDDNGETWFQSETMQSDNAPIFRDGGATPAGWDALHPGTPYVNDYSRTDPTLWTTLAVTGIGDGFTTFDDPSTWYSSSESTDGESWSDITMAVNDGDYETFLVWNPEFFGSGTLIGKCNGISDDIAAGKDVLTSFVDEIYDPQTITPGSNGSPQWSFPIDIDPVDFFYIDADGNEQTWSEYQLYRHGAQTANGAMILACCPSGWSSSAAAYPVRRSTDGGATWTNVTSIPTLATTGALGAAFAAGGTIAYVACTSGVYKSTDSAATFSLLAGSPSLSTTGGTAGVIEAQVDYRIKCSADGQVIFMGNHKGGGWVSTDGGTSWSTKDFGNIINGTDGYLVMSRSAFSADYAMTPDGTVLVAGFTFRPTNFGFDSPFLCISNDSGATWSVQTRATLGICNNPTVPGSSFGHTPANTNFGISCVAVAPDGQGISAVYHYRPLYPAATFANESYYYGIGQGLATFIDKTGFYVDISIDQGATWINRANGTAFYIFPESGAFGFWVGMYMVGPLSYTPPTPDPEPEPDAADNIPDTLVLNYNTLTKAWYPWSISRRADDTPTVYDVKYLQNPGATVDSPDGIFKYVVSYTDGDNELFSFGENLDTAWLDWNSIFDEGMEYESYFVTGYKLHGQALRKWQPEYLQIYSRNEMNTKYHIQGVFGFGSVANSGRWSNKQLVNIEDKTDFGMWTNKLRIRGSGLVLQLRVSSVSDNPFDIMGWSMMENQNPNV